MKKSCSRNWLRSCVQKAGGLYIPDIYSFYFVACPTMVVLLMCSIKPTGCFMIGVSNKL